MSETNKSYRIRTNVGQDSNITVNLDQDYNVFEILSVKLTEEDTYKLHSANYGVIVGRVLANEGFGVPNAKISVFIEGEFDENTSIETATIYPYSTTADKNSEGVRYNLLPDNQSDDCHQVVGTFPNKTYMLDNDVIVDVFDKYYVYTTRTNNSGDYLICGVPTGNHTIHMDLDLSDCGILSQRPRDFVYKGYTIEQFENPNQFKTGTSLDSLSQVFSQDTVVNVIPFWGNEELGETIGITRADINVAFKFEPTCVFMGSLVADNSSNGISKKCIPTNQMGAMDELTTGEGTIEMIRKTANGDVEEFQVKGTQLIDGNGVWCYQIPMNLDYMMTDEYGNMVPTDDPSKGIPTRARVRFRISMNDMEENTDNYFRAKVLVPHNPQNYFKNNKEYHEDYDYEFGSNTREDSFRDLFWNDVYTVKSYIPRFQKSKRPNNDRFSGIKHCNIYGNNNPIPYNNIRIKMPFMFILLCAMIKTYIRIVYFINGLTDFFVEVQSILSRLIIFGWDDRKAFAKSAQKTKFTLIADGICPDLENWYFAPTFSHNDHYTRSTCNNPNCDVHFNTLEVTYNYLVNNSDEDTNSVDKTSIDYANKSEDDGAKDTVCLTIKTDYLISCIEMNLAQEYKVINFDFYNDWVNGVIYMPRWMRFVRKKRTFLFGLIKIKPKVKACIDDSTMFGKTRYYTQQCALTYGKTDKKYTKVTNHNGCMPRKNSKLQKCHKSKGLRRYSIFGSGNRKNDKGNGGIVHENQTMKNQYVYYFKPCEWRTTTGKKTILFANDLVLLGSLNECNLHGVPQAFKYLTSSSYVMPTNLALTNMDDDGYLYAAEDTGTICGNSKNYDGSGLTQLNVSFETEQKYYSTGKEDEPITFGPDASDPDTLNYDDTIPLTEAAGIAWNYTGPGQGEKSTDVRKSLYYPGGHFLGLSCVNSETNIKSCVNLQRICEMGTTESQRREEVRSVKYDDTANTASIEYKYFVPTGLIAQDEITGSDFRSMFATMNQKRLLCTDRIDEKTGYPIYDFTYMRPIGFDGSLKDRVSKTLSYNENIDVLDEKTFMESQGVTLSDDYDSKEVYQTKTRTIEDASEDYYMFRLGLSSLNDDEQKSRFLYSQGSSVALPQYENSYYFYFGLRDGATALDEFNKQFFSVCETKSVFMTSPTIKTNYDFDACTFKSTLNVTIENMSAPATMTIKNNVTEDTILISGMTGNVMFWSGDTFSRGSYEITVTDNDNKTISKIIEVGQTSISIETEIRDFEFRTKNITNPEHIIQSGKTLNCGYIDVGEEITYITNEGSDTSEIVGNGETFDCGKSVLILFDKNYNYVTSDRINHVTGDIKTQIEDILKISVGNYLGYDSFEDDKFYVWSADSSYDMVILHRCCESGTEDYAAYYDTFVVNGCDNYDIYLGSKLLAYGSSSTSGVRPLKDLNWGWWNKISGSTVENWAQRHYLFRQTDDDTESFRNNLIALDNNGREIDTILFGQPEYFENDDYHYFGNTTYYEGDSDSFPNCDLSDESVIPTWPEDYSKQRYGLTNPNPKFHYGEMATYNGIMASEKINSGWTVVFNQVGNKVEISGKTQPLDSNVVKDKYGCVIKLEDETLVYPVRDSGGTKDVLYYYGEMPENPEQTVTVFPLFFYPVMYRPFYANEYVLDWVNNRLDVVDSGSSEGVDYYFDCESWKTHIDIYNGVTYNGNFNSASTINGEVSAITVSRNDLLSGGTFDEGYSNIRTVKIEKITDVDSSGYTTNSFGFDIIEGCPSFTDEQKALINSPYSLELAEIEGELSNDFPSYINYKFDGYGDTIFVSDSNASGSKFFLRTGTTTNTNCPLSASTPVNASGGRVFLGLINQYFLLCRYNTIANNISPKNTVGEYVIVTALKIVNQLECFIPMYTSEESTEKESVTVVTTATFTSDNPPKIISINTTNLYTKGVDVLYSYKCSNIDAKDYINIVSGSSDFMEIRLNTPTDLGSITYLPSNYYIVGLSTISSGKKGSVNVARVYPYEMIQRIKPYTPPSGASIECVPSKDAGLIDGSTVFPSDGGSIEVRVKSTTAWNFRFEAEPGVDTSWIKVNNGTTYSGNRNETLTITATGNPPGSEGKVVSGYARTNVSEVYDYVVFEIPKNEKVNYIVKETTTTFPNNGGQLGVVVKSNNGENWTLTLQETGDWVKFSNNSTTITGNGNSTVYMIANANVSQEQRLVNVTISSYLDPSHQGYQTIEFSQNASQSELIVTPTFLSFSNESSSKIVDVVCNGNWESNTDERWITLTNSGDTLIVLVGRNDSGSKRTGTIIVSTNSGTLTKTISVEQAELVDSFIVTTLNGGSTTIDCTGETRSLAVSANTNWEYEASEDWIHLSKDRGVGNDTINVTIDVNNGSARNGRINVYSLLSVCDPQPSSISFVQNSAEFAPYVNNYTDGRVSKIKVNTTNNVIYEFEVDMRPGDSEQLSFVGIPSGQTLYFNSWTIWFDDEPSTDNISFCGVQGSKNSYGMYVANGSFELTYNSNVQIIYL